MFYAVAFVLAFVAGLWAGSQIGMNGTEAMFFGMLAGIVNLFVAHSL